jgi:hypothetical protein
MPETWLFRLGADVHCTDGVGGKVRSLVISPADDAVTHLVVEPAHRQGLGKLVPLSLAEAVSSGTASGEVRLACTMAEFGQLDPAEAKYLYPGDQHFEVYGGEPVVSWPYYSPPDAVTPGTPGRPGYPGNIAQVVTIDTVPDQLPGEDEVSRGEQVHATDGDIGHILGIAIDPGTGRLASVLLREGHWPARRTVLIPRSAVAGVTTDGFHLGMTRHEVQHLPPADTGQQAD